MYISIQTSDIKWAKIAEEYKRTAFTKAYLMIQVPLTLDFSPL